MRLPSLCHCLMACVLSVPALAWADTLLLTIEVKGGQHRLVNAQTLDRNVSSPPRSTPDYPQLLIEARNKEGVIVYAVKMDSYWDAPADEQMHMPLPDSYVLRIPKAELVQSLRVRRVAEGQSNGSSAPLLDIQKTPSGWR